MASAEVKSVEEQKRELLARSQQCREALMADCGEAVSALAWVPKTVQLVRSISPVLLVAAPLVGWLARKKMRNGKVRPPAEPAEKKKKMGVLALAWQGYRIYKQVAPFVQGFMKAWPAVSREHQSRPQSQPPSRPKRTA